LFLQSLLLLFLCIVKSNIAINWANIQENFNIGFVFIASNLYIPSFLEKIFVKWGLDLNLGQILFGYEYMGPNINYKDFSDTTGTTQGSNTSTNTNNATQGSNVTATVPTVEDLTTTPDTVEDPTVTADKVEDTKDTPDTVEDPMATEDIIRASEPTGDIDVIYSTVMRKDADYAYFWTVTKKLEFYSGVNENYNYFKTYYPEDKLKAYDNCLYKLKQTNRRALVYYDDLSVIKYMSNAGLLSDDLRSKLGGLGSDEPIAFRQGVFSWVGKLGKQLIEELTSNRSEFIKQINTKIPEETITDLSTANVSEETIAGPSTANVLEETIAGPSKRPNPMNISNILNNPSNSNNSPILSQIDPEIWQASSSDSESDNNRPNKRPRILEEDPTGNRKGKEKEN